MFSYLRDRLYHAHWVLYQEGCNYLFGEAGHTKDAAVGIELIEEAADAGDAFAQLELYVCYRDGVGVKPNSVTALTWLHIAATHGHQDANAILGAEEREHPNETMQAKKIASEWVKNHYNYVERRFGGIVGRSWSETMG